LVVVVFLKVPTGLFVQFHSAEPADSSVVYESYVAPGKAIELGEALAVAVQSNSVLELCESGGKVVAGFRKSSKRLLR